MQGLIISCLVVLIFLLILLSFLFDTPVFSILAGVICLVTAFYILDSGITYTTGVNSTVLANTTTTMEIDIQTPLPPLFNNFFALMLVLLSLWLFLVSSITENKTTE